jgi:hypothetical protein
MLSQTGRKEVSGHGDGSAARIWRYSPTRARWHNAREHASTSRGPEAAPGKTQRPSGSRPKIGVYQEPTRGRRRGNFNGHHTMIDT